MKNLNEISEAIAESRTMATIVMVYSFNKYHNKKNNIVMCDLEGSFDSIPRRHSWGFITRSCVVKECMTKPLEHRRERIISFDPSSESLEISP